MRTTKIVKADREVTDEVLCNNCGESMKRKFSKDQPNFDIYGLEAMVFGGYLSDYLLDGCTYKFDLCERCLTKMFNKFKIEVTIDGA